MPWHISPVLANNISAAEKTTIVLITADQLTRIAVDANGLKLNNTRVFQLVSILNAICPKYGITTIDIFEEFLATILAESDCFRRKSENMNYTHEQVILNTWPTRFKNLPVANLYVRQPEKLANLVYGARLGNKYPGDGYLMRGCGFIQMTGREICSEYFNFKRAVDPGNTPGTVEEVVLKVRTDDGWALDSACWTYCIKKKLIGLSIDDRFIDIEKAINGGLIGIEERKRFFSLVKKYMPVLN